MPAHYDMHGWGVPSTHASPAEAQSELGCRAGHGVPIAYRAGHMPGMCRAGYARWAAWPIRHPLPGSFFQTSLPSELNYKFLPFLRVQMLF